MADTSAELSAIRAAIAACFAANAQPLTMSQAKAWIAAKYATNGFDLKAVHGQIRAACVNKHYTRAERRDAPKVLFYDGATRTYRRMVDSDSVAALEKSDEQFESIESDSEQDDEGQSAYFALERQLRDFLATNLGVVEKGLQLWTLSPPSIEFPLTNDDSPALRRRIDILAKDESGIPVLIELKLSRAHDKVIGQALLYRAMLRKKLNVDKVRIVLIALDISDELRLACEQLSDVFMFEYAISMKLNRVGVSDDES